MVDSLIPAAVGLVTGEGPDSTIGIVFLVAVGLIYFLYQLKLLSENGWTLGKKMCRIKIVRRNGSTAGVGRILGLRIIVPGLIGVIPVVGIIFGIIDALFIFSDQHRTVHDRMADTLVVVA